MTNNNTCMMTWNSPMYSKSLQNKFLILVAVSVHFRFWSLSRPKGIWGQCWNGGVWVKFWNNYLSFWNCQSDWCETKRMLTVLYHKFYILRISISLYTMYNVFWCKKGDSMLPLNRLISFVAKTAFSTITSSIPWLLMPCSMPQSPGHQQQW